MHAVLSIFPLVILGSAEVSRITWG